MGFARIHFIVSLTVGVIFVVFFVYSAVWQEGDFSVLYYLPARVSKQRDINGVLKAEALSVLSRRQVSRIYHDYVNTPQVKCRDIVRAGKIVDGGWDVCVDPAYKPSTPCLVYSFGINNDFSFDDYMANHYGCEVHSYDPSMTGVQNHLRGQRVHFHRQGLYSFDGLHNGWTMRKFSSLLKDKHHSNVTIDVLKIDIEVSERVALPEMLSSGSLRNVKQLCFEMHIKMPDDPEPDKYKYISGLSLFLELYKEGFRIFKSHRNMNAGYISMYGMERTGCHEIYMIRQL